MEFRNRLVEDFNRAHRWASVRLSAFGVTIFGSIAAFPALAAEAWNAIPATLRERLPDHFTQIAAALLFAAVIFGRVHQKKDAPDDD